MAKIIRMTPEMANEIKESIFSDLMRGKLFNGELSYRKKVSSFKIEDDMKAILQFTPVAYSKMLMLVMQFSTEIGWRGVVHRDPEDTRKFIVTDILVPPQIVTGSHVDTDENEHSEWMMSFDDDVFNHIRMQGHSHVNFSTSPSAVDQRQYMDTLAYLGDEDFYVFLIYNKRMERTISIYDMKNNICYDNDEIVMCIGEDGVNLKEFLDEARSVVREYKYNSYSGTKSQHNKKESTTKEESVEKQESFFDENDDPAWNWKEFYEKYVG